MTSSSADSAASAAPSVELAREAFYAALADDDPETLYERAPCAYLTTTPDGLIVKVNQTFLTLTELAREDVVGRLTFPGLLNAGGRIYYETHYAPLLLMHGQAREIAFDLVCADGSRLPVLVNSVLDRDPAGRPTVIRTALFDATERRSYERELLAARQRAEAAEAKAVRLARTLQDSLIPPAPPRVPGLDVAARYRPAEDGTEVGGDFYDVFEIHSDDWVFAIGDVSGKGVEAAVITSLVRYTLRGAAVSEPRPSAILATVNSAVIGHPSTRSCTALVVRLRRREGEWVAHVCAAGHPLPLLLHRSESPRSVGRSGPLLGIFPDVDLSDVEVPLSRGDALVLFTDGVTEGRRGSEFFGAERLSAAVVRDDRGPWAARAGTIADGLLADVLAFQDNRPRDDVAILTIVVPGPGE